MSTTFQPVMLPFPPITELQGTVELEQGGTGSEITAPLADALFFYNSTTQTSQLLTLANHIVISGTFGVRNFGGATAMTAGQNGLVPAPLAGDQGKFLRADGTWANIGGGGDLLASNNLSDLSDLQEAKDNLNIAISDVANLQTSLDAKAATSHAHAISDVTNLQTTLNGKAATSHAHAISDVTNLQTTLDAKANTTHSHAISDVTNLQTSLDAKANTTHSHAISDVTNLQTSLDAKANTSHSHAISDITNLQTTLDGKAATSHSHAISDVTNLQTTLDGKAATSHAHAISDVTNLQTSLDAKLNAANPSSTGIFIHTGGANEDATFNVNNNGRFRVTIDDIGRSAGWQNAVFTTRFDEASTNQVGVQADFTHTTGNASSTNFFTPLASSIGGSNKANFLVSYNPAGTWTNSTDVKGKLRFHVSDNFGISFGSDTSSGNRRFFFGSWSQEFGIIVPNGTNYDITIPSTQGASGTVLTNDGSGVCSWAAVGVTGFTGSQHTSSPNATVNVSRLLVTASSTNADFAITPKGTGAIIAHVPDGTATGGNKRGANAIDLQTVRVAATQVASGSQAVVIGANNTASGNNSTAIGVSNTASGLQSVAIGSSNNVTGTNAQALGSNMSISGDSSTGLGVGHSITGKRGLAAGNNASVYIDTQFAIGDSLSVDGDAQSSIVTLRVQTTNNTPTKLTASSTGGTTTWTNIPSGKAIHFIAKIVARNQVGDVASFIREGLIKNQGGSTSLVGSIATMLVDRADAGMASCTVSITADDTNDRLQVEVTGNAGQTIRWVCTLLYTEVAG